MSDRFVFDLREPYPGDVITETFRQAVVAQIDGLTAAVAQLKVHDDQVDAALLLTRTAFDFAETMLQAVVPLQQALTAQAAQITAMQAQIDALNPAPTPAVAPPDPTTGGTG